MTHTERGILIGSLTVNALLLAFFAWLMWRAETHSPVTVDGPTCIVKVVRS